MKWDYLTIHRYPSEPVPSYGSSRPAPTDVPARGRVRPSSGREVTDGRQTLRVEAVGVIEPAAEVDETDEITANGKRYRVVGVFPVSGLTLSHTHIDLVRSR